MENISSDVEVFFAKNDISTFGDNKAMLKVSKNISIEDVQQSITNHLNILMESFHLTPWDQNMYTSNMAVVADALNYIKEVLFINRIVTQKAYALLGEYMADTKNILDVFFKSYCHIVAENCEVDINKDISFFLKGLVVKQTVLANKFLTQLFNICIQQNNPLVALEIGLSGNGVFKNCEKLQDYAYDWIKKYSRKSQLIQISILRFAQKSDRVSNLGVEAMQFDTFKEKAIDLYYEFMFESLVFNLAIDRTDDSNFLSHLIAFINNEEPQFENTNYYKIVDSLIHNTCINTANQKIIFIKNVKEIWSLIHDKHMRQTDNQQNVQITMLKRKFLDIKLDECVQAFNFQQNNTIKNVIKSTCQKFEVNSQDKNETFLKQYKYENLLLSSELSTMIVETPFKDPYFKTHDIETKESQLYLKLNYYQYLILLCFQNDDQINFENLKNGFYENLNICYPNVVHDDNNSKALFKKSLKPFYKSSAIVSYIEDEGKRSGKIIKWSKLLIKWKDSFEKNDYTNFTLSLNFKKKLSIYKNMCEFDSTIGQYVYIL